MSNGNIRNCKKLKNSLLISSGGFLFAMFMLTLFLIVYHTKNEILSTWHSLYASFAMAALISVILLLIGWLIYGLYVAKMLIFAGLFALLGLVVGFSLCMAFGWNSIVCAVTGAWIGPKAGTILTLIGMVFIALSVWCIYYFEVSDK